MDGRQSDSYIRAGPSNKKKLDGNRSRNQAQGGVRPTGIKRKCQSWSVPRLIILSASHYPVIVVLRNNNINTMQASHSDLNYTVHTVFPICDVGTAGPTYVFLAGSPAPWLDGPGFLSAYLGPIPHKNKWTAMLRLIRSGDWIFVFSLNRCTIYLRLHIYISSSTSAPEGALAFFFLQTFYIFCAPFIIFW